MVLKNDTDRIRAIVEDQPPFAGFLMMRLTEYSLTRIEAELFAREELGNRNGVLHGGAIMALADNLGGTGASIHLADGKRTATIESKTNFLRAVPLLTTVRAVCIPLHLGRTTMVWQTTVTGEDRKVAAIVTQTQLVIAK